MLKKGGLFACTRDDLVRHRSLNVSETTHFVPGTVDPGLSCFADCEKLRHLWCSCILSYEYRVDLDSKSCTEQFRGTKWITG